MPAYKYSAGGKTKWYAAFYAEDWKGKRKHHVKRGFSTQREAKEYERLFFEQAKDSPDMTFSALVENYLEDMEHRLKPITMENKRYLIDTKILPYFGRQKLNSIDTIKIRSWQNELTDYRDEDGTPYSQTYLKSVHSQLSAIFNYAVKHYRLRQNPCRDAGSMGRSRAGEMNIWTQDEFEKFLGYIRKPGIHLAFNILFYSGMRLGELLALTPADFLPGNMLRINKQYVKIKGKEITLTPKTPESVRTISLPNSVCDEEKAYAASLCGIKDSDRLFYFTKYAVEYYIKAGAEKAGVRRIRVHDLRHSHVSLLIHMKVPITEISKRLGHRTPKVTLDTYAHMYEKTDDKIASMLDSMKIASNAGIDEPKGGKDAKNDEKA